MSIKGYRRIRVLSIILLFITGLNALVAGYLFILDPSGKYVGITTELLEHSPFKNYLIPGLVLFTFNGIMNIVAAGLTIRRIRFYPYLILFQGIVLVVWILLQVVFLQMFQALHFVMGVIGIVLIICGASLAGKK